MKHIKLIALILAVMMLATGLLATASAGSAEDKYYNERVQEFEAMKKSNIWINMYTYDAFYALKTSKLYGRRITGVAPDGSWILGPWEILFSKTSYDSELFSIMGTYCAFAYSFDIVWGTDWPYSGVFWNNPETRVETIRIQTAGTCRMASIRITVDDKTVVNESNCSSHSEWTP